MKRLALGAVLFLALTLPSLARAELVPGSAGATDSLLAVGADGLPRVAFVAADGSIVFAARSAEGSWAEQTVPARCAARKPSSVSSSARPEPSSCSRRPTAAA